MQRTWQTRQHATSWNPSDASLPTRSGRDTPLAITESSNAPSYWVYDGGGTTIDVRHRRDHCITINASFLILRGLTLKGAGASAGPGTKPIGAIRIEGGHDY